MEEEQETFQGNGQRLTANEKQTQVASFPVLVAFHRLTTYFSPSGAFLIPP